MNNKHDWRDLFVNDTCRICWDDFVTGTAKANHAKKHVREGKVDRAGDGTVADPFRYLKSEKRK